MSERLDTPTEPMFVALASALASIEAGVIAEAEVEARTESDDRVTMLTVTVRKTVRTFGPEPTD